MSYFSQGCVPQQMWWAMDVDLCLLILQVRAVIVSDIGIVTASRDKTIKLWKEDDHGNFICYKTLVTSATMLSHSILARKVLTTEPMWHCTLQVGHTDFVICLAYREGTLVSGEYLSVRAVRASNFIKAS